MTRFRVVQFNMQFAQAWDDADPDRAPVNIEGTLAEIRRHDADIVFLQEVEHARAKGDQADPPPNYSRLKLGLPGYDSCFEYPDADVRELPFGIGLAIFSRTPLRNVNRIVLASPPVPFEFNGQKTTPTNRLLITATTTITGHDVRLLNTHLLAFFMLGTSSGAHPEQRNRIAQELGGSTGPTLLAGDFNVRDHEALTAQYARCGFRTVQQQKPTWRRQPYILDHIFHNADVRCVGHRVVPTRASDHHVLVADFEFAPTTG